MQKLCSFCKRLGGTLKYALTTRLLAEPHEGASLGVCVACGQTYVHYFVEHRDDLLDYFCQVSLEQKAHLLSDDIALLRGMEVRSMISSHEVYFRTPWRTEWAPGADVLMEPRPWQ